jgi:hypothetical protein
MKILSLEFANFAKISGKCENQKENFVMKYIFLLSGVLAGHFTAV